MSHQILLLPAMLTLGLAISQHRDQLPCRTVRHQAGRVRVPVPSLLGEGCPTAQSRSKGWRTQERFELLSTHQTVQKPAYPTLLFPFYTRNTGLEMNQDHSTRDRGTSPDPGSMSPIFWELLGERSWERLPCTDSPGHSSPPQLGSWTWPACLLEFPHSVQPGQMPPCPESLPLALLADSFGCSSSGSRPFHPSPC